MAFISQQSVIIWHYSWTCSSVLNQYYILLPVTDNCSTALFSVVKRERIISTKDCRGTTAKNWHMIILLKGSNVIVCAFTFFKAQEDVKHFQII